MMTNDTIKRASFGFDPDFDDLSSVKPTGITPKQKSIPKRKLTKPKTVAKAPRKMKPKHTAHKAQDELADHLARSQGFTSREASQAPAAPILMKKRRRVHHEEPVDQLSIRGPVRVLNGFIDYCEAHKLSYWEGMERLVEEAG